MSRSIGAIAVPLLFLFTSNNMPEDPVTFIPISDSLGFEVTASFDSVGLPEFYGARVYTPICEGGKCYAVELDLYWDLSGRFLRYDTLPGRSLSKLDHIPFTDSDYVTLKEILNNSNSVLASFSKEELVKDTRISTLDGFTGATVSEVKAAVIEGAVYSCYTLWHIAHGPVSDSLKKHTLQTMNRELVRKLVEQEDPHMYYFLIRNFSESDFKLYVSEILETIQKGQGYYAKNAIEILPVELVCEPESQEFFAGNYKHLDYFTQVALLEKLEPSCVLDTLYKVLLQDAGQRNSYKNELINSLK